MKHYPSIDARVTVGADVVAFDKLDGSNVRAEWSRKKGIFYKFGSRKQLIDARDPVLGPAPDLIRSKYEAALNPVFRAQGYESVVCFFEFFGPSSFAGWHDADEKERDVVIFDIAPFKRGILPPDEFLALARGLHTPAVLHRGPIGGDTVQSVRDGTLLGMTFEGIVCKASGAMFKIKSRAWLERLKERCGSDERLYKELA